MRKLQTVSESIRIISEGHVDTDQMIYADQIAKALQKNKTELGNMWTAEIMDATSDYVTGNGGGHIKYTRPAVPDEVNFHVEIENRKSPEPELGEDGMPIPGSGDSVAEETGDVKITVSINDNPAKEQIFKDQALSGLLQIVSDCVQQVVVEHHQKQTVNEGRIRINEEKLIKGESLTSEQKKLVLNAFTNRNTKENATRSKKLQPNIAATQSDDQWIKDHAFWFKDDGKALSTNRKHEHAEPAYMADDPDYSQSSGRKSKKVDESTVDLAAVAAGIAGVVGSGVGLAALMEYLKKNYPEIYKKLSKLGSAATDSRARGVNK